MKVSRYSFSVVWLLSGLCSTSVWAIDGAEVAKVVDGFNPHGFGIEIAIQKDGKTVYEQGFGERDRGKPDIWAPSNLFNIEQIDQYLNLPRGKHAPDAGTVFSVGSVSKEFTAGALLLLQQEKKLSVSDKLSKYFPEFPQGKNIPLLYLLQHRSGIPDYNEFPQFATQYQDFALTGQQIATVNELQKLPLNFKPGTQYQYSNSNYLLLGLIVEKVSGKPLSVFLEESIFQPLKMKLTHTNYDSSYKNVALGYTLNGNSVERVYAWNLAWLSGPGGLTSTVGDLAKWDAEVVNPNGIFKQAALNQMFQPSPISNNGSPYACGWVITTLNGHKYIWHNGEVGGFHAMNALFPNDKISIQILSNGGNLSVESLIPSLFNLAL